MKRARRTLAATLFCISALLMFTQATQATQGAQATPTASPASLPVPELAHLGDGVVGALHRPAADSPKAGVAVYVMHAEQDYLAFPACTGLAARGYTVLCANNAASKMGLGNDLDFERMMQPAQLKRAGISIPEPSCSVAGRRTKGGMGLGVPANA